MPDKRIKQKIISVKREKTDVKTVAAVKYKLLDAKKSELLNSLSPQLKVQIEQLLTHEAKINKLLTDPKQKEIFMKTPDRFFEHAKIDIPALLKRRLQVQDLAALKESKSFIMPNGQALKPIINIKIK